MAEVLLGGKKLGELKVTELKTELEKRGLQKKGVKSVLLTRLKNAILREALSQDDTAGDEDEDTLDVSQDDSTLELNTTKEEQQPADGGSEDMELSDAESGAGVQQEAVPEDNEPLAMTPTHELDPGHMSGAEETTPTVNPPPAVVPSPDDSAKEGTGQEQDQGAEGNNEEDEREEEDDDEELKIEETEELRMEEPIEDDEEDLLLADGNGSEPAAAERLDSIDPSYNPSREELLYEGDMETEMPSGKGAVDKEVGAQDEGFIVSVHDTGMELDMTESLTSHSKTAATTASKNTAASTTESSSSTVAPANSTIAKTLQSSRHPADVGGAKTAPTTKSGTSTDSKRSDKSSSPNKSLDRCSLWVSGLIPSVRALDLQTLFSPYAQVISAKVVAKSRTKQLRFGFITVATPEEAQTCIMELNGTELKGKKITVDLAKTQPPLSKVATGSASSKANTSAAASSSTRDKSGTPSGSDKKQSSSSAKSKVGSKSSTKSIADRIVERSRRSVDARKVTTTERSKDNRRKSAPLAHRSRSHSRERIARLSGGHRPVAQQAHARSPPHITGPVGRSGHVSVHSRLGAMPPTNQEAMQREMAERDMYIRDRERQVEIRMHRQLEAERTRREQELAHRLQEIRDRENREREMRERQLMEQERLFKEKERELREREYRERQRREALERELRERETREVQFREREKRMKEVHEKEIRERELRALKERELRERDVRLQNERERELRERERRIKEEQERIERERRAREEQQRWIREEAARVTRAKEEAVRIQKEREEVERSNRERREEKERREEELRLKREQRERERQERDREREQKRERDEMEKRMQGGSGRLGKRPYQQDNGTFDSKRPAYSPNPYPMSNTSSIFNRLEPHKGNHRSGPSQTGMGVPSVPMIQPKDLPHVNPEIINAASQALANIRKSVPPIPSHLTSSRGSVGGSALQAQIQQLAAATALASATSRVPNVGMEFRGGGGNASGPQHFSSDLMRPSMSGRGQGSGLGVLPKSPHLRGGMSGGGRGGLGKLPPEDQRYNRRLGGSRSGGGTGSGGYRGHGRQGRGY